MLYFGYGLNTNPEQMAYRCPQARSLGHARLINHSFRFAQFADVEPCAGSFVEGVLWEITEDCLRALDQLEGYPTFYNRVVSSVVHENRTYHALVYRMQPGQPDSLPTCGYYNLITQGYRAHGVPTEQLENSVAFSTTNFG
jgi:gamma-glutamylcyclotransferase (GGCT)/AIG2-like uncharacterized protein YtfP